MKSRENNMLKSLRNGLKDFVANIKRFGGETEIVKPKRGRPIGSKNKIEIKKCRGRPIGSKNKTKVNKGLKTKVNRPKKV